MRASSALIFEYGTSISGFCARVPLRTRAKKSAIGSVTVLIKKSGWLRGGFPCPVAKRHAHLAQQRFGFRIRSCRGDDCNIKSDVALDFIQLDFRKNRLVRNSQRVVAVVVKTTRRDPAKVANAGESGFETLKKFVHTFSAQGYLCADGLIFA